MPRTTSANPNAVDAARQTPTAAATGSSVGSYDIVPSMSDPDGKLANYSLTMHSGSLTVQPAALMVWADDQSRVFGSSNPTLTGSLTGIQSGDNITATYSTTADTHSAAGGYDIVPSLTDPDNKLGNYSVTIINGTLTITTASSPPGNLTLRNNGNGTITLKFTGGPGAQYLIQAATSLVPGNWATIGTGTADSDGKISFTDPDAGSYQWRFYRAAKP